MYGLKPVPFKLIHYPHTGLFEAAEGQSILSPIDEIPISMTPNRKKKGNRL